MLSQKKWSLILTPLYKQNVIRTSNSTHSEPLAWLMIIIFIFNHGNSVTSKQRWAKLTVQMVSTEKNSRSFIFALFWNAVPSVQSLFTWKNWPFASAFMWQEFLVSFTCLFFRCCFPGGIKLWVLKSETKIWVKSRLC